MNVNMFKNIHTIGPTCNTDGRFNIEPCERISKCPGNGSCDKIKLYVERSCKIGTLSIVLLINLNKTSKKLEMADICAVLLTW